MGNYQQPNTPTTDDKINWAENHGALMLIFPTNVQTGIKTQHGECDAVAARIVRLEDGRVWENGMIFPTALVNQTRAAVPDGMVLGRLGQGQNTKGNPPWIFLPHTAEDEARADAWIAANPINQYAQPQQQAATPQWGAPQAPPTPAAAPAWGAPASSASPAPATAGWGAPPPVAQPAPNVAAAGWGAPAPAAPSAPAAPAQQQFPAAAPQWGEAPAPAPAPAEPLADPGLVEALRKKGQNVPPGTTHAAALGVWAMVQHQPDTVA